PLTILVDAAHGAGSSYVLDALAATGAIVTPLSTSVGVINDAVGATSPGALAAAVRERGADAGIALDGDADRCVAVDERGQPVDGDVLIALLALDRHERRLAGADRVVATVLTNTAIERRLTAAGIALERTQVGDRHVAEELRRSGAGFGGEKSGHLLFPEHSPTGDGIISAIHLVGLLVRSQQPLSVLVQALPLDPQVQSSVAVGQSGAQGILENPAFIALVQEQALLLSAVGGRLVVRASGTEPLLRIMGEAPDAAIVQQVVDRVAALASRLVHEG
ncbi:MAG: phosphoglucosamine mutase, partial [Chloroflexi bacterium]